MESSSLPTQHQLFQLFKLPTSDVEKHAGREWRGKNCGQIKADDEFGIERHGQSLQQRRNRVHLQARSLKANIHGLSLTTSTGRPVAADSNKSDAAWSSQVWQAGARSTAGAERPAAMGTDQNPNPSAGTDRPVAWDSDVINIQLESP